MAKVRARNKAEVGADLKAIWDAPEREAAMRGFEAFTTKWIVSEEPARQVPGGEDRAGAHLLRLPP